VPLTPCQRLIGGVDHDQLLHGRHRKPSRPQQGSWLATHHQGTRMAVVTSHGQMTTLFSGRETASSADSLSVAFARTPAGYKSTTEKCRMITCLFCLLVSACYLLLSPFANKPSIAHWQSQVEPLTCVRISTLLFSICVIATHDLHPEIQVRPWFIATFALKQSFNGTVRCACCATQMRGVFDSRNGIHTCIPSESERGTVEAVTRRGVRTGRAPI
jgi:hypothetical protein